MKKKKPKTPIYQLESAKRYQMKFHKFTVRIPVDEEEPYNAQYFKDKAERLGMSTNELFVAGAKAYAEDDK